MLQLVKREVTVQYIYDGNPSFHIVSNLIIRIEVIMYAVLTKFRFKYIETRVVMYYLGLGIVMCYFLLFPNSNYASMS